MRAIKSKSLDDALPILRPPPRYTYHFFSSFFFSEKALDSRCSNIEIYIYICAVMFVRVIQQCDSRTDAIRFDLYDVWENIFLEKIEYLLRFVLKDSRSNR